MKTALSFAAILVLFGSSAFAQGTISTGCFHYGVETCDPTANPPTIGLPPGFHMGPVDPSEGENLVPRYRVVSAECGNGIGPKLSIGDVVDFAGTPVTAFGTPSAAVVIYQTVYQVGKSQIGSLVEEGKYLSASEFEVSAYQQDNSVATVSIQFSPAKVTITSRSESLGVCELVAQ